MGETPGVVDDQNQPLVADGRTVDPVYTGPRRRKQYVRRPYGAEAEISKHLRGDRPTLSGFFDATSKKVACLRCDQVFVSRSRENRLCPTCRSGTEALVVGAIPEAGIQGGSSSYGGVSPARRGTQQRKGKAG